MDEVLAAVINKTVLTLFIIAASLWIISKFMKGGRNEKKM